MTETCALKITASHAHAHRLSDFVTKYVFVNESVKQQHQKPYGSVFQIERFS
jgi:hypothetical protein